MKVEIDAAYSASLVRDVLPTAAPEFQEKTEDGSIFRIYKVGVRSSVLCVTVVLSILLTRDRSMSKRSQVGSLEIRTVEEKDGKEQIGVVYSSSTPTWNMTAASQEVSDREKVTECKAG